MKWRVVSMPPTEMITCHQVNHGRPDLHAQPFVLSIVISAEQFGRHTNKILRVRQIKTCYICALQCPYSLTSRLYKPYIRRLCNLSNNSSAYTLFILPGTFAILYPK